MTTTMIDEYFKIHNTMVKEYGELTVVLMALGSFYEVYGVNSEIEDIGSVNKVAEIMNIVCSKKNKSTPGNSRSCPKFCGFTTSYLPKYLPLLLQNGYTVVIVDQLEDASTKKGDLVKRGITAIHSPSLQPPDIETSDSNNLMNILIEIVGVKNLISYVITNNACNSVQILEQTVIEPDEVQRIIYRFNPNEINVRILGPIEDKFTDIFTDIFKNIQNCKIHSSFQIDKLYTKINFQNDYFKKVYSHINFGLLTPIEYFNLEKYQLSVLNFMYSLDFISNHSATYIKNLNVPLIINENDRLLLELNTCAQLNLKELINIVDFTSTAIGKRALKQRIFSPFKDVEIINNYYNLTEFLRDNGLLEVVDTGLSGILDFERMHRKMGLVSLHPYEFVNLYNVYLKIQNLINILKDTPLAMGPYDDKQCNLLDDYLSNITDTFNLVEMEKNSLIDCVSNYFNNCTDLDEIVVNIKSTELEIEKLRCSFDKLINIKGAFKLNSTDQEGYFFTCTKVRFSKLKIQVDVRYTSNSCKIFTKELSEYSRTLIELKSNFNKQIKEHWISYQKDTFIKNNDLFNELTKFIELVDITKSNLKCSLKYNYCKPEIKETDSSYFKAIDLRHPIIERINVTEYIPNDIELTYSSSGILLYGLNSGGKSSLLRSIGTSIVLAQAGLYVPCKKFEYTPFNILISQVDLTDNLFKQESSFVNEMKSLKKILDCSGKNTLVLGDELCRGTEPMSATAIICASISKLLSNNTKFFLTSHLHQISSLVESKLKVKHLSVEMSSDHGIIFNRKLKDGSGSDLYGIEVAKSIIQDLSFIDNAFEIRNKITGNTKSKIKKSNYNKKKIMDACEVCGYFPKDKFSLPLESHHLTPQKDADSAGFFKDKSFHKNQIYNLVALCKDCHDQVDSNKLIINGYKTSTNGRFLDFAKK
jgi:DNA mismatch repair protein MutS